MNKSIKKEVYSFIMKEIKNPFWRTAAEYGTITISIWIMVIGIYFFKFPNHFAFGGDVDKRQAPDPDNGLPQP